MNTWIISKPKQIGKVNTTENLEQVDEIKHFVLQQMAQ